jgi:hypothetical protein
LFSGRTGKYFKNSSFVLIDYVTKMICVCISGNWLRNCYKLWEKLVIGYGFLNIPFIFHYRSVYSLFYISILVPVVEAIHHYWNMYITDVQFAKRHCDLKSFQKAHCCVKSLRYWVFSWLLFFSHFCFMPAVHCGNICRCRHLWSWIVHAMTPSTQ